MHFRDHEHGHDGTCQWMSRSAYPFEAFPQTAGHEFGHNKVRVTGLVWCAPGSISSARLVLKISSRREPKLSARRPSLFHRSELSWHRQEYLASVAQCHFPATWLVVNQPI